MTDTGGGRAGSAGWLRRHSGVLWSAAVLLGAGAVLVWIATGGPGTGGRAGEGGRREAAAKRPVYVTARVADVRSRPSDAYEVVGRLEHRERVLADSTRRGWTHVAAGGRQGWVKSDLLFAGDPPPCEIASWGFQGTTVAGTLQNYTEETLRDLRLRIIYYNELGQIVNASLVRLPDVPPASAPPENGKVSFRTTTAPMGTEQAVRLVFGRLRPLTVTIDWTLELETGVWWYSGVERPRTSPDESSADIARRVLQELGKEGQ